MRFVSLSVEDSEGGKHHQLHVLILAIALAVEEEHFHSSAKTTVDETMHTLDFLSDFFFLGPDHDSILPCTSLDRTFLVLYSCFASSPNLGNFTQRLRVFTF